MSAEEARRRLGLSLDGPLDAAELRHAYLKAIKRHKPEADPEGFQAVRLAYEKLAGLATVEDELPVSAMAPPPAAPDLPTLPKQPPAPPENAGGLPPEMTRAWLEEDPDRALAALEPLLAPGALPDGPLAREVLHLVLHLEASGDQARADRLRSRLEAHLGQQPFPAEPGSMLSSVYLVARELGAVSGLPPGLRRSLARGALEWDFGEVQTALLVAERDLGQRRLNRVLRGLRKTAPELWSIVGQHRFVVPGWLLSGGIGTITIVLMLLVRGLVAHLDGQAVSGAYRQRSRLIADDGRRLDKIRQYEVAAFRLCYDPRDEVLCKEVPPFLRSLHQVQRCGPLGKRLADFARQAHALDSKDFIAHLTFTLPELCRP
jgi:hypothetical protein